MRRTADAVVIGGGILGTSIGLELGRQKLRTIVVDRHGEVGAGSTQASTAIVRSFYGTRPAVALALEGRHVFEAWAEHLDLKRTRARFRRVGCALLYASRTAIGAKVAALMRAVGVDVETLAGREARGLLVPALSGPPTSVLFEPGAGYVTNPAFATRDVREAAESHGVNFLLGEHVVDVRSIAPKRNGARRAAGLTTASGLRIDAPIVVNAAGPHSAHINLLARQPLGLTTAPLAQRVIRGAITVPEATPVVADLAAGHYVRFDSHGFRMGTIGGPPDHDFLTDADLRPRTSKSYIGERRRAFQRRHPGLRWSEAKVRTALYDVTVLDWYPILDKTDLPGYYVAIGTSGSWFKGAPTLGWMAAQLIAAVENGRDHDSQPLQLTLPRTGRAFDVGFFSRNRAAIRSELGRGVLG